MALGAGQLVSTVEVIPGLLCASSGAPIGSQAWFAGRQPELVCGHRCCCWLEGSCAPKSSRPCVGELDKASASVSSWAWGFVWRGQEFQTGTPKLDSKRNMVIFLELCPALGSIELAKRCLERISLTFSARSLQRAHGALSLEPPGTLSIIGRPAAVAAATLSASKPCNDKSRSPNQHNLRPAPVA